MVNDDDECLLESESGATASALTTDEPTTAASSVLVTPRVAAMRAAESDSISRVARADTAAAAGSSAAAEGKKRWRPSAGPATAAPHEALATGSHVEAIYVVVVRRPLYRHQFFPGVISRVNSGTFDVVFDDGDTRAGIPRAQLRPLGGAAAPQPTTTTTAGDDRSAKRAKLGSAAPLPRVHLPSEDGSTSGNISHSRPVVRLGGASGAEVLEVYCSITDAALKLGLDRSSVSRGLVAGHCGRHRLRYMADVEPTRSAVAPLRAPPDSQVAAGNTAAGGSVDEDIGAVRCTTGRPDCSCLSGRTKAVVRIGEESGREVIFEEFCSGKEAERSFGFSNDAVAKVCRGVNKAAGGHRFRFKSDFEASLPLATPLTAPIRCTSGRPDCSCTKLRARAVVRIGGASGNAVLEEYCTITDAAHKLGLRPTSISDAIYKACLTGGHRFRYKDSMDCPAAAFDAAAMAHCTSGLPDCRCRKRASNARAVVRVGGASGNVVLEEYCTMTDAESKLGLRRSSISDAFYRGFGRTGGHQFRFKDDMGRPAVVMAPVALLATANSAPSGRGTVSTAAVMAPAAAPAAASSASASRGTVSTRCTSGKPGSSCLAGRARAVERICGVPGAVL